MRKYSAQELLPILASCKPKTAKELLPVTEARRQEILTRPAFAGYLQQVKDIFENECPADIPALPYSSLKLWATDGDRDAYQAHYFPHRKFTATALWLTWLYGDEKYLHYLENALWALCDEYSWCLGAHLPNYGTDPLENEGYTVDLFASETSALLCECLALVGDKLPDIVVRRIRKLLEERIFSRFETEHYWWEDFPANNWASVCVGNLGTAILYEIHDTERLAKLISKVLSAMENYIASFPVDGTGEEGVSYWFYGFQHYVYFADMLYRYTDGKIDMLDDERVHTIAVYPQKCYHTGDMFTRFGDCGTGDTYNWWGLFSYLHTRFADVTPLPRPRLFAYDCDRCFRWLRIFRDIIWADEDFAPEQPGRVYGCFAQPCSEQLLCNSDDGLCGLSAKGGHNGVPHNHNDVGTFQYFKNGEEYILDLGAGVYSRASGAKETRYTFFFNGSQGHNVPIIGEATQLAGKEHGSRDVTLTETSLQLDFAAAYGVPELKRLQRSIAFDRVTGKATVTDEFSFTGNAQRMTERFNSYMPARVEGNTVLLQGEHGSVTVTFDPDKVTPQFSTYEFIRTNINLHRTVYIVDFVANEVTESNTFTFTFA